MLAAHNLGDPHLGSTIDETACCHVKREFGPPATELQVWFVKGNKHFSKVHARSSSLHSRCSYEQHGSIYVFFNISTSAIQPIPVQRHINERMMGKWKTQKIATTGFDPVTSGL